jgi:hypothetical protein
VASSRRARPLPIWSAGGSRDRARGRGLAGDLGPCRPGPMPAEPPGGSATVRVAQGEGEPGGKPKGNRNRATAEGTEPENAGRRETRGRRRKGKDPGGQTGNRRRARRGNRRTCGWAPDHPVRVRGSGAPRIYDAAGTALAGLRGLRIVVRQLAGGQRPPVSHAPDVALPENAGLRPLRLLIARPQWAGQSSLLAYRVVRRGSRLACGSRRWPPRSGSPACSRGRRCPW